MPSKTVSNASKATLLSFFILGLGISSFLSEIPAIRDNFGYTPAQMGNLLLSAAFGAFFVLPISGSLVAKHGPRVVGFIGITLWATGISGMLLAYHSIAGWLLICSYITANVGAFLINASINVEGGFVEVAAKTPRMAWYHAAFSIGTVTGALIGVGSTKYGVHTITHLTAIMVFNVVAMFVALKFYLPPSVIKKLQDHAAAQADPNSPKPSVWDTWKEKRTLLIGVMVFGTGLMEGSASDWMSLAVVDGFEKPAWYGTMTLAIYLTALTTTRLFSPRMQGKYSPDRLLRRLIAVGLAGVALVAFTGHYPIALIGAVLWGIGVALGYPLSASVLATDPLRSASRLSVMSTISFGSSIAGPAVIGYLAEYVGYKLALGVIIIPGLISLLLTTQLREDTQTRH
ncbi:transporter, major facilitator family protein [Gleimia coleocanis DSM 15436]|uniref:Transporter, major facilitator family protein n=1 Tax=Gleimia coleocanis DSM 15436 TaxID=525245 RepID=C0VYY9_9ACTO|nr:MFS transporter [Gleimia coleocanis]EEH64642.1 transporter, major facilitator family protein [Gleimia coleocanis DSM 15436]